MIYVERSIHLLLFSMVMHSDSSDFSCRTAMSIIVLCILSFPFLVSFSRCSSLSISFVAASCFFSYRSKNDTETYVQLSFLPFQTVYSLSIQQAYACFPPRQRLQLPIWAAVTGFLSPFLCLSFFVSVLYFLQPSSSLLSCLSVAVIQSFREQHRRSPEMKDQDEVIRIWRQLPGAAIPAPLPNLVENTIK